MDISNGALYFFFYFTDMNACKVKVSLYRAMIGTELKLWLYPFITLALNWCVVIGTSRLPYPYWQHPCTDCTKGWVDLVAGLGGYREEKLSSFTVARTLDRVTRSELPYRLRCPNLTLFKI